MDLVEISLEMAKIPLDLKNFAEKCFISQFGRVSLSFREQTYQSTCRFRVLEAETLGRPSLALGRPVLELDQTG